MERITLGKIQVQLFSFPLYTDESAPDSDTLTVSLQTNVNEEYVIQFDL